MYSKVLPPVAPKVMDKLLASLQLSGINIHEGFVWTTDAPYRETVGKVLFYQNRGVLAVDMETSALFGVARFRGIALSALLMVSDSLSRLKWKPGMKSEGFLRTRKIVLENLREFFREQVVAGDE
jgi:purine-nucleoside phosphorylase